MRIRLQPVFLSLAAFPLGLSAQTEQVPGALVNGRVVVRVLVTLSDSATPSYPVPSHQFHFYRGVRDSTVATTDTTGRATVLLGPGEYRLVSARPFSWRGYEYSWNIPVVVRGGMSIIALRRPDATASSTAAGPNRAGAPLVGGLARGVVGAQPAVDPSQTYFDFQVEKRVEPMPNSPAPVYPEALRSVNIEGNVLAQFAVDTTGRADMSTFKVLKETNPMFAAAVRAAVATTTFSPAEVGGRKVRQLVQMPYHFQRQNF
jgi:TonB family protein